jgi:catechol 2,3-dioxygenase-like lactoylglutathione lyase family enzyme
VTRLVSIAAFAACLVLAGPVRGEDAASAPEVSLKRVNLLVRDMDRSLAVYRDILGFRLGQCTDSRPESFSYPVFRLPAEAKLRFCLLDSTTEVRALALTQVTGIEFPPSPPIQLSAPVIRVQHHQDVQARLEALGLEVVGPRRSRTAEGHDFTEFAFTDADGHLIVLYELD